MCMSLAKCARFYAMVEYIYKYREKNYIDEKATQLLKSRPMFRFFHRGYKWIPDRNRIPNKLHGGALLKI